MSLKIKKIIAAALSLLCISIPVSTVAAESEVSNQEESSSETIIFSGHDGNLQWKLTNDRTLYFFIDDSHMDVSMRDCCITSIDPYGDFVYTPILTPWQVYGAKKLVIEDGISYIGKCAFYGMCFEEIELADSVKTIGDYAFYNCKAPSGETKLKLSANLKEIMPYAFYGSTIKEIVSQSKSLRVDMNAFEESTVSSADFSQCNYVMFGTESFYNCTMLSILKMPKYSTDICRLSFTNSSIKELVLPENVEEISGDAFRGCKQLEKIILSNNLKTIRTAAFSGCNLKEKVVFPNSCEMVYNSFVGCGEGNEYVFLNKDTTIGSIAVGYKYYNDEYVPEQTTIYGYRGSTAEEYCNGIDEFTFIALDDARGDINYDAQTNVADAILLQNYLSKKTNLTDSQLEIADLNQDGSVNVFDNIILKRLIF